MQKTTTTGNFNDPAGTWQFLYNQSGHMIQRCDGTFWQGNVFAGGRHLATVGGGTYFRHSDWLGTERFQTVYQFINDPWSYTYCTSVPFGDALTCHGGSGNTGGSDISPLHFTGKERDSESGPDNFGARYFSSSMGRFTSPDWSARPVPVPFADPTDPQSLNLYSYVRNNPLSKADSDGHCGAPSGLQPGQVGICVASFIKSNTIGLIGRGDDRGPNGHGGTSRIATHLTVDQSKGTVTKPEPDKLGRSGIICKECGLKGTGESKVSDVTTDKEGTTHFQVSQDASSAMSMGGVLFGNIDNHLNLDVTKDQQVGIEGGSSAKDYPSLEVYSYTVDAKGNITETQILFKQESGNSSDLKKEEKPIKENSRNDKSTGVLAGGPFCCRYNGRCGNVATNISRSRCGSVVFQRHACCNCNNKQLVACQPWNLAICCCRVPLHRGLCPRVVHVLGRRRILPASAWSPTIWRHY